MSSGDLKKVVKRSLFKLEKDRNQRSKLNKVQGQLFIFAFKEFIEAITLELRAASVKNPSAYAKKLEKEFSASLSGAGLAGVSTRKRNEMLRLRDSILNGELPAPVYGKISSRTHKIFLIKSYRQVSDIKSAIGTKLENETGVDKGAVTGIQAAGSQRKDFKGLQLGHGEYGAAVSGTRVLAAEQLLGSASASSNLNAADKRVFTDLKRKIQTYKETIGVIAELEANTVVNSRGNFKASFIPILSGQLTKENQEDAVLEQELLDDMAASFTEAIDILNQKGSRSNKEAIEDTLISNFTGRKGVKYKGSANPTKKVNKKSTSGKVKKNFKNSTKVSIAAGAAVPETKTRKSRNTGSSVPFAMISVFNKELPGVLQKNMNSPRLNYVTGRFANSVSVTNVISTAKGYPSFSFTYDKYPYQTFEPGYRQGSQERDPRKLIDSSMREIAAKYALGRFFTRRQ